MDTSDLHIGGGIHDLEVDGNRNFKWTSDLYCLYFNDTIESITLEIFSDFKSNCWYYLDDVNEDSKITLSYNSGFNRIKIINKNFFKLNIHQNIFIPAKINKNSNDFRKLSYRIYNIDVVYTNGKIKRLNIKDVEFYIENENLNSMDIDTNVVKFGLYGEMFIKTNKNNPNGKINLNIEQTSFYSHRSGWNYVLQNLFELNNPNGIIFDGFVENAFSWRKEEFLEKKLIPYKKDWIGVLHNPPNMPLWFSDNNSYPQSLIHDKVFKESLKHCRGLYVLSNYYKKFLSHYIPDVNINVLYHPTEIPDKKFDINKFYNNKNKSIVNVGWWLRKLNSIFLLDSGNYQKIRLMPNNKCKDTILRLTNIERDLYNIILSKKQIESVKIIDHLDNNDYDVLLSQNIVFLDLYDTSANNAVIECIARGTPLLVNRHPATIEYLGEEYPFYFDSLKEANEKLNNIDLIRDTHKYLMTFDKRKQITIEYFKEQLKESEIYQSI